jgi:hypothetical protein
MRRSPGRFARRSLCGVLGASTLALVSASTAAAAPTIGPRPVAAPPGLQHGRAYEQVSPVDKNGGGVSGALMTRASGGGIVYQSTGAFAGTPSLLGTTYYRSLRGADGWITEPVVPATTGRPPANEDESSFVGASEDLTRTLLVSSYPFSPDDVDGSGAFSDYRDLYRREADGSVSWLSKSLLSPQSTRFNVRTWGASPDGEHALISTGDPLTPEVPAGAPEQVYVQSDGKQHLISEMPGGGPSPERTQPGTGSAGFENGNSAGQIFKNGPSFHPMSEDGQTVYFQVNADGSTAGQIYVRTNALRANAETRAVGNPCSFSAYLGASADGARMRFWCVEPASGEASDPGVAMYEYDRDRDDVRLVPGTENTFMPAFVAADEDMDYMYFRAGEVLAPGGVANADNLYVLHAGAIRYVGELPGSSGEMSAAVSQGGTVLAFRSTAQLDPGVETAGLQQIYVYDAEDGPDGTLTCVSCRSDGQASEGFADWGNSATFGSQFGLRSNRRPDDSVTADGRRVFFTSTDRVVPEATNGVANVFEYFDGRVSLVSSGKSPHPSVFAGASADGQDAFFVTHEALVPQDIDGTVADVYSARIGGGIAVPAVPERCAGDACRGPASSEEDAAVNPPPAGSGAVGRGNVTVPSQRSAPRTVQLVSLSKATRSKLAAGRLASLELRTRGRGTVSVRLRARIGTRTVTVGVAKRTVRTENVSKKRLKVRLSERGVAQLRRSSRLRVRVEVRMSGVSRPATRTVTLTRTTATKKGSR